MWPGRRRDPRVGDELRFHRDRVIDDYIASGMDRREAERRAFLEFGSVAQIEEACRDVRGRWLDDLWRDLCGSLRSLRRNRAFSAVAVLLLGLGIGANAAIFTLINAVMLRTLPVNAPDRLVQLTRLLDGRPGHVSYPLFEHFRDHVMTIAGAFAQGTFDQAITIDGEDEFVTADLVSGDYSTVLDIEPAVGRLLGRGDDAAAVISDGYWQRRFGRSPSAIGKTFTIRDHAFTIVGVTAPSYQGAQAGRLPDLILPLAVVMSEQQRLSSDFNSLRLLARLKPGASVEQTNAEVQVLFAAFRQSQAERAPAKERPGILAQRAAALPAPDGFNPIRDSIAQPLLLLMAIVGLILMVACVNLSGLLLARAAAREREISIRLAIGAGRGRLVRQFLTESLVLAALGGGAGLGIAGWSSARLFTLFVSGREVVLPVAPDWRVLAFTCLVSLLACLAAGLAPALQAVRMSVNPGRGGSRAVPPFQTRGHGRLGKALVVTQLAMSMVLVVGATLFVGTLLKLYAVERGFDSEGVLVVNVRSSRPYPSGRVRAVQSALLDRLGTLPGVRSASAAQVLPVGGGLLDRRVEVEGYRFRADESEQVGFNVIAPGYFATLDTPILSGREFTDRDTGTSPGVAIVNESFARYFFGASSPLGRRVTTVNVSYEIVGVAGDAKYQTLRDAPMNTMYMPWTQREDTQPSSYSYLVRVLAGDPMRLTPGLDRLVREADPALRVRTATAYAAIIDRSIAAERMMATLAGFFGLLALLIAALGVFGVLAFQVARRTNELGVRMALGASRWSIRGLVLRDVALMVGAGVSIGAGCARVLTGLARPILFGMTAADPGVFVTAASILAGAAMLAGWLPAVRASQVDAVVALRHE